METENPDGGGVQGLGLILQSCIALGTSYLRNNGTSGMIFSINSNARSPSSIH